MTMMENFRESYNSMMETVRHYGKVAFWSGAIGAALMGGLWIKNYTPSERIA